MSKEIDDGGPAFPGQFTGHCGEESHAAPCGCYVEKGASLRDLFAAHALTGVIAMGGLNKFADVAFVAYQQADAMLKARKG